MTTGQWVLVVAVALAVGFGVWRAKTDGRFRASSAAGEIKAVKGSAEVEADDVAVSVLAGTPFADRLGERATLLQFSSAFCAPCRMTKRTLEEVVPLVEGVAHVEVDAEMHLELVRQLDVMRTPTTLVLDSLGREVTRAAGVPTKQQVLSAVAMVDVE